MDITFDKPWFPEMWDTEPVFTVKAIEDACKKIAEDDSLIKQTVIELLKRVKDLEIRINVLEGLIS